MTPPFRPRHHSSAYAVLLPLVASLGCGGGPSSSQGSGDSATSGHASPAATQSGNGAVATAGHTAAGATGTAGKGSSGAAAGSGAAGMSAAAGRSGAGRAASGGAGGSMMTAAGSGGTSNCTAPQPASKGMNPLFSDQYTADPAPFVHDCTFYIHCGHDEAAMGQNSFVMKEWFVLSSTDMVHWNKQVGMKIGDFKWANANSWAGQVVEKGGKFYWYVPVNETSSNSMAIGVAVADSPTGPFKDALGKALIDDAFEMSNAGFKTPSDTPFTIDPTVFVDDDGQAYLHYGGFSRMLVAKLGSDMISIDGKMKEVTPQGFFEAAFLTKHNGTYYEIYAAGSNPATIDYATSTSPLGPWMYRGRILDKFPTGAGQDAPTNHAGVAQLGDQWYIVYHISNGPNGGGTYRREVSVDKLTFNADGTIAKVTPSAGLSF